MYELHLAILVVKAAPLGLCVAVIGVIVDARAGVSTTIDDSFNR